MTENSDHETGGTLVLDDIINEACGNRKFISVDETQPTNLLDGMIWHDTSTTVPVVKVYDGTNAAWTEHHRIEYASESSPNYDTNMTYTNNGDVEVQYAASTTYLLVVSNSTIGVLIEE